MTPLAPKSDYYLVVDNQPQGPLSFEQLLKHPLTPDTLVWTAGMEQWAPASTFPELAALFTPPKPVVPPPTAAVDNAFAKAKPPQSNATKQPEQPVAKAPLSPQTKSFVSGLVNTLKETFQDKRYRYGAIIILILLSLTGVLQVGKAIKKANLEEKNRRTEERNKEAEKSQEALLLKAAEQEALAKKEQERREREIKASVARRVSEIQVEIELQKEELVLARQKFSEVTAVKLFRSAAARSEEVNAAMDQIKYHEEEIERLQREIKTVELNGQRAMEGRAY